MANPVLIACPLCGIDALTLEGGLLPHHVDHWASKCEASGCTVARARDMHDASNSPCNHHWHEPKNPLRMSRPGLTQAACCRCGIRGWAKLKKTSKKTCRTEGPKLPKCKIVEINGVLCE